LACAASGLLLAGLAWYSTERGPVASTDGPNGVLVPAGPNGMHETQAPGSGVDDSELAWNDAFDDRLAEARLALWQVRGSAARHDVHWQYLQDELRTIDADMAEDSL
jgi:hypothetical protein